MMDRIRSIVPSVSPSLRSRMSQIVPLTPERHAGKRWIRPTGYGFTAGFSAIPVGSFEMSLAAMAFPLCFMPHEKEYFLVALLGLAPGRNLFVAPDGRWIGSYVPAAFRVQPFCLARNPEDKLVLCIDEESGLASDNAQGEVFFDEKGSPAPAVAAIFQILSQREQTRPFMSGACAALHRHGVLKPWELTVRSGEGEQRIEGLYQVDEAALTKVDDQAFLDLRAHGALPMAYCQLLSSQHVRQLGQLADAHAKVAVSRKPSVDVGQSAGQDILNFDALR